MNRPNPMTSSAKRQADRATPEISKTAVQPIADLLRALNSDENGLSAAGAAAALRASGPNQVESAKRKRLLFDFLGRFANPLVLILLFAAAVSAFTGDIASFAIISAIVLVSVILDVAQDYQAQNAAERLRAQVSLKATALRDGRQVEIAATEIAPGDVLLLGAGDLVPADARLLESKDLYVDEALLTGEAYPAEKEANPPATAPEIALPPNLVFMGSSVVSGAARAVVFATGRATQIGAIARALQKPPPPTAFAVGIQKFGMMIVRATIFLVLFVVLINLLFHRKALESFMFALALAVGLTPELLPMIVSVTLARGALRMAKKGVIVKRQTAIDDLGSMNVFCSDKTGTLTEARIKLIREVDLAGRDSGNVMHLAQINAAFETGIKSPLDEAILAVEAPHLAQWRKIDEQPFDFERRRVSVLVEGEGRRMIVVKGAPEDVLRLSQTYDDGGTCRPLDAGARKQAEETFNRLSAEGFRLLGVASREVEPDRRHASVADETELTFAGFLAFLDPPKEGAREALASLASLGVAVKVVTGDNELVTRHVCGELGVDVTGTLTGPEIAELTDAALMARIDDTILFCRVTPPQKARIISTLRRKGHVVGYMGDGINDGPPLHAADVGFSVDTAVDVAKEAASMILLRKDLNVLADGVREGRRTFANILKYIMMGTSSNFGNMFSMAGAVLFVPFLPMLPTQILLNNLLYDLSETAIPLDRVSESMVAQPHRWDFDTVRKFMLIFGPLSSVFDYVTFALLLWAFKTNESLFHTGWFVESMATQVMVIFLIRTTDPLRDRPHPALVATTMSAFLAALALPFSPLASWLGFVPLPGPLLAALAAVTAAYLLAVYFVKRWFFARHRII
ncbi:magnesium-translocating P-type ATPase [Rhodoblastus acidophilus]|uniref:Magnesium-transporting ATPase, P-type 1 n=1 Tax=Candidatus Rhodoblastus alkanivorans TaxID=2954117 RepID=A0ABS9Z670_9HYPH|nr:magnesium-translocating P-type ATPase [Candidatus Rhodoblastus alkanivorans]MCI4679142.1 magnesium-translocating P-type ATPase [Candidatus Rhodoblastus alkanivorans]MCI4683138.1 magnesium-translocating P-type ATPase [Candidatus Rhodoblastus alkanivorans]MDI4640449.1 magnesium-translocating P-type ATPase [Rhodoblastus acidophilus]